MNNNKFVDLRNFKPDLIPNNKGNQNPVNIAARLGIHEYMNTFKKDGVRMQAIKGIIVGRSLKVSSSILVQRRFQPLAELCEQLNISLDGEFYAHGMRFLEINRFYKNEDVTRPKVRKQLEKDSRSFLLFDAVKGEERWQEVKNKDTRNELISQGYKTKLETDWPGRSIEWLCTFHKDLKFHLFDGLVLDRPDLKGYEERMNEIIFRLKNSGFSLNSLLVFPTFYRCKTKEELIELYEKALKFGYEGLVLTKKDHHYKFGRNTLVEGSILKMKDEENQWDGVVLDVVEGTQIKEGIERTRNELGQSVTSKCKDDREPSGMAKGFKVQFQNIGTFKVPLKGFTNEEKRELLENKEAYIGRHFVYEGMPPVKDFPRSVFFKHWRDEK